VAFAVEAVSSASTDSSAPPGAGRLPGWPLKTVAIVLITSAAAFLLGQRRAERPVPRWKRLTFRRGNITGARFARDGQSVLYSARWGGDPVEVFSIRRDAIESRALGLAGGVASISTRELAVVLPNDMLARLPLEGGVPREIAEHVSEADWAPDGTFAIVRQEPTGPRIEFPPGHVLYEAKGLGIIGSVRVSPRGDRIAFVDHPSGITDIAGDVVVMGRSGDKTVLSRDWLVVRGLAWSPDGREIWFTATKSGNSRALHAVTLEGRERLVAETGADLGLLDIFGDGRVLLEQGRSGAEARGRMAADVVERDYSWLDATFAATFTPDGRSFVFNESGDGGGPLNSAFLRRTDGSPPLRLGDGSPLDVSPDGKWFVGMPTMSPRQLLLVPIGPGEARALPRGTVSDFQYAKFLPDGKRLVVVGSERGRPRRFFVQTLPNGLPQPFAPEGTEVWTVCGATPDGRSFVGVPSGEHRRYALYPLDGGPPQPIPGMGVGEIPVRFSADGASLFVREGEWRRARIVRLDLRTGRKTPWLDVAPPDPAGVRVIYHVDLTADGKSYLYGYERSVSDLYVVEGLR
jgi:dipeptidyl aminopeptidase/acylaminoacyl peptidase